MSKGSSQVFNFREKAKNLLEDVFVRGQGFRLLVHQFAHFSCNENKYFEIIQGKTKKETNSKPSFFVGFRDRIQEGLWGARSGAWICRRGGGAFGRHVFLLRLSFFERKDFSFLLSSSLNEFLFSTFKLKHTRRSNKATRAEW